MIAPTFSYLNEVYFGGSILEQAATVAARHGLYRPLLVTDRTLSDLGIADRAGLGSLPEFADVETNPTESAARSALTLYRAEKCDGLIAIGGGSPIDLAKVVALLVGHDGPLGDYAIHAGGPASIDTAVPSLVAVPTTAGSGSEVGRAALMTLEDGRKVGFLSPKLLPVAAVCDPAVTMTMPALLTAACGMDAISHCVEAIVSSRENPVAGAIARDGLRRGVRHIVQATESAQDLAAKSEMMICALEGGLAFQKGLGAVHSLSHPLGGLKPELHHGTLNGLFLPVVLAFNEGFAKEGFEVIRSETGESDVSAFFARLLEQLGLPSKLSELGVVDSDLVKAAPLAKVDHCTPTNPRPFTEADALALYRSCL
ncbi:MAG: 4-hydroxybutyrate dehydrogenase [Gemmatimonadetes bacterium]|nr:4-hydroxybutyrate dehydrogenase [Gemmatimonadota bacterium]|tara:strand:- start:2070 stop:3179 length:1110 start_codon:yes stop_codon:yes gene_type:complete